MNTKIIIGAVAGIVIIGGGIFFMTGNKLGEQKTSACADLCQQASEACPSLVNQNNCNSKCAKLSEDTKKHLRESTTCEQIASRPDLITDLIIPEMDKPEQKEASNDCESACANYVNKCLTLVPNADQALFQEGLNSCMDECFEYSKNKVDCLINATDCPAMTEQCGL